MNALTLLKQWPQTWRFPRLWIALCNDEPIDANFIAEEIVAAEASPLQDMGEMPQKVWELLIEQGEFLAAEKLLEQDAFQKALADENRLKTLNDGLQQERLLGVEELNVRCWLIAEKIDDRELDKELADVRRIGSRRLAVARRRLNDIEGRAEQLEKNSDRERPRHEMISQMEINLGPQLRLWPYEHEPIDRICQWFLNGAAAGAETSFESRWKLPDDLAAQTLINTIFNLTSSQGVVDPSSVAAFGRALTMFLTGSSDSTEPAQLRDGFYWTELRGLGTPWLPAPTARHGLNWPLAVPDPASPTPPASKALANLICVFDPWMAAPQKPAGALVIKPDLIFSLMPDPNSKLMSDPQSRLEGFLHALGWQIPLAKALPEPFPDLNNAVIRRQDDRIALFCLTGDANRQIPALEIPQLQKFLTTFLGYLGLSVEDTPAVLMRMIYCSGKNPRQLLALLRHLFYRLGTPENKPRAGLNRQTLEATWLDTSFRNQAGALVTEHLKNRPLQRLIIALLVLDARTLENSLAQQAMPLADLLENLESHGIKIDRQALEKFLAELRELDFIEHNPKTNCYRLPANGMGTIVSEAIGGQDEELDGVINLAKSELKIMPQ